MQATSREEKWNNNNDIKKHKRLIYYSVLTFQMNDLI